MAITHGICCKFMSHVFDVNKIDNYIVSLSNIVRFYYKVPGSTGGAI